MKKLLLLTLFALCAAGCKTATPKFKYDRATTASVIIGVEQSKRFGTCVGSVQDATKMSELLKDYSSKQTVLISKEAHLGAVREALAEAVKYDLAIIYYSGHGGSAPQDPESAFYNEPSGYDSFLCLWDNPMLDDEVWEIVSKSKGRVVLIFDCCHSATMFREPNSFFSFGDQQELFAAGETKEGDPRILVLAGCPDESFSYGSQYGGEMTISLLHNFKPTRSYDSVFSRVLNDRNLKSQKPNMTEIGESFKDQPIFK